MHPAHPPLALHDFGEHIFDTLREPFLVLDSAFYVRAANASFYRTFGADPTATIGTSLYDLGNGHWDVPALRTLLEKVLPNNEAIEDFDVAHRFEHIGWRHMLLNARRLQQPGAKGPLILLALEDVTARTLAQKQMKKLNAQLSMRNTEMEQFTYTVSHDLKSPLVTINGFLGLLTSHLANGDAAKAEHALDRIRNATHRMSTLIDDLLQLSRVGHSRASVRQVDVQALVQDVVANLAPQAEASGCTLHVASDLPDVEADPKRVQEVFENLLSNAFKYACPPGQRIDIGTRPSEDERIYYVRDDGPGIDPAYHERIFVLFQRLHSDPTGTGIGLALVAKVMLVNGGRAWVESVPGQGATFCLAFPK